MPDFATVVQNIGALAPALESLILALAYFLALFFAAGALFEFNIAAEDMRGRETIAKPVMMLAAAVLFASFPTFVSSLTFSIYGQQVSPLAYVNPAAANNTLKPLLSLIVVMGYAFIMKGVLLLAKSGDMYSPRDYSGLSSVIAHFVGGAACVAIDLTLKVVASLTGWDVSRYVN